jgi:hypothetical protein
MSVLMYTIAAWSTRRQRTESSCSSRRLEGMSPAVAVEDDLGAAVPGLDDVEPFLDLALERPLA